MQRWLFAAALAAILLPRPVEGQYASPDPKTPMITASGSGEVKHDPDAAVVRVGLEARGSTPNGATVELERLLAAVRDSLRAQRLPDSGVVVGVRELKPTQNYPDREITGYTADVSIEIRVRDLPRVPQILNALTGAGATEIPQVRYVSDQEDRDYAEAMTKAVADATRRAEASARAAGGRLGAVLLIDVDGLNGRYIEGDDVAYMELRTPAAHRAEARESATVTIYWRFEGR